MPSSAGHTPDFSYNVLTLVIIECVTAMQLAVHGQG